MVSKTALLAGGAVLLAGIGYIAYEMSKGTATTQPVDLTSKTGSYSVGTGASVKVSTQSGNTETLTSTSPSTVVTVGTQGNVGVLTGVSGGSAPIGTNVGGASTTASMVYEGPNVSYAYRENTGAVGFTGYGLTQQQWQNWYDTGTLIG